MGMSRVLTPRQLKIAELLAEGLSNKEIALILGISHKTVKVHIYDIFARLGVNSRMKLAIAFRKDVTDAISSSTKL